MEFLRRGLARFPAFWRPGPDSILLLQKERQFLMAVFFA